MLTYADAKAAGSQETTQLLAGLEIREINARRNGSLETRQLLAGPLDARDSSSEETNNL